MTDAHCAADLQKRKNRMSAGTIMERSPYSFEIAAKSVCLSPVSTIFGFNSSIYEKMLTQGAAVIDDNTNPFLMLDDCQISGVLLFLKSELFDL